MPRVETKATTLWKLATAKAWCGVSDQSDNSKDADLVKVADAASEFIERYTRRKFVLRSITETRDGDGSNTLFLYWYPVGTLTSLAIRRYATDAAPETITSDAWNLNARTGKVYLHSTVLSRGVGNVAVTYTAGYDVKDGDAIPQDVSTIGLELVKLIWQEHENGATSVQTINIGNNTLMMKPEWPKQIKQMLDDWRRPY